MGVWAFPEMLDYRGKENISDVERGHWRHPLPKIEVATIRNYDTSISVGRGIVEYQLKICFKTYSKHPTCNFMTFNRNGSI